MMVRGVNLQIRKMIISLYLPLHGELKEAYTLLTIQYRIPRYYILKNAKETATPMLVVCSGNYSKLNEYLHID